MAPEHKCKLGSSRGRERTCKVTGGMEEGGADTSDGVCSGPSVLGGSVLLVFSGEERVGLGEKGFGESRGSLKPVAAHHTLASLFI